MAIKQLPEEISRLIAAGEVVERPASVIKELLENSIDAGASHITIEIKNGGITYMRVTDDGCGIAYDEMETAFLRHATSKIAKASDLDAITTMGFRGEALAVISSVSDVTLITKRPKNEHGGVIRLEAGRPVEKSEWGAADGTTMIVERLFYNTPARMKFLKKDSAEASRIADIAEKTAIARPDISFRLISDDKTIFETSGNGSLEDAVYSVFGKEAAGGLIRAETVYEEIRVSGFVSPPGKTRPNRTMQLLYVNGRVVKNPQFSFAAEEAYKPGLPAGRFPAFYLFVDIDPSLVDVNVHPAKIEVKFADDRAVARAGYYAVKSAIQTFENEKKPSTDNGSPESVGDESSTLTAETETPYLASAQVQHAFFTERPAQTLSQPVSSRQSLSYSAPKINRDIEKLIKPVFENKLTQDLSNENHPGAVQSAEPRLEDVPALKPNDPSENENEDFRFVGEIYDTYMVIETADEVWFFDKHALHERVIYEDMKNFETSGAQLLMEPAVVNLSAEERAHIFENMNELESMGFDIEDFGGGSLIVRQFPMSMAGLDLADILSEFSSIFASHRRDMTLSKRERCLEYASCRKAIKAGGVIREDEAIRLARKFFSNPDLRNCPHGRSVSYSIPKRTLDSFFGRR